MDKQMPKNAYLFPHKLGENSAICFSLYKSVKLPHKLNDLYT